MLRLSRDLSREERPRPLLRLVRLLSLMFLPLSFVPLLPLEGAPPSSFLSFFEDEGVPPLSPPLAPPGVVAPPAEDVLRLLLLLLLVPLLFPFLLLSFSLSPVPVAPVAVFVVFDFLLFLAALLVLLPPLLGSLPLPDLLFRLGAGFAALPSPLVRAACSDPNPPSPPRPSELVAMLFAPVLAIPFDLVSTPPSNASALPLLVLLATSPAVDCCWCAAMVVGACCCAGLLLLIAALSLRTPAALSSCSSGPAMLSSLETKAGSID